MKNKFHMILRFFLFPLGYLLFPCKIMDKKRFKKYDRAKVIIGNHLSWKDIGYMIFWVPGYKHILSKKENLGGRLRNWFMRKIGIMFVDRDKPELSAMRNCVNVLKNGESLCIFPEGTRNKVDRKVMEMHPGAALFALKAEVPVVPVAIHHRGKLCKRNYIGIGDPIDLSDFYGKRVDEATLNEATARFRAGLENTLAKLDKWVEEKGWKTERKKYRNEKRALKKQYKSAKKQAKRALKESA